MDFDHGLEAINFQRMRELSNNSAPLNFPNWTATASAATIINLINEGAIANN